MTAPQPAAGRRIDAQPVEAQPVDPQPVVPQPLLIVGHGTVDAAGVAEFTAFIARMRARLAPIAVAGGFIELSAPAVNEAWQELADRGHRRLAAVPLVLVAAGHAKGDIPAALQREVQRHPDSSYQFGRPLGPHPILLDLLAERIAERIAAKAAEPADTAVVLVGRGSTDPDANAEVCKVARLLQETRGFAFVETAFVSLATPNVADGLRRAKLLGARRVVVAPYFLFDGVLPQRVIAQAVAFGRSNPDVEVLVAGHIGDCDGLAELVELRYHEALHGDIRMNCDTCAYRVLLPGFEDKLGAPQTPHHHPDDPAGPAHGHGHGHAGSHVR